jgi:antitoxin HicB
MASIQQPTKGFSGRFVVRVPRTLHAQLTAIAELDGVSLNSWVSAALAESMGRWKAHAILRERKAEKAD